MALPVESIPASSRAALEKVELVVISIRPTRKSNDRPLVTWAEGS